VNIYYVAAIWLGMALLATVVSIRIAVPAALVEIVVGALAGNIPGIREHVAQTPVVVFLASVGSLVLTFLAGAEIDPVSLRGHWKASLSIGLVSFALPFLAAFAGYAWLLLVFLVVSAGTVALLPRLLRLAIRHFGHRVSEPEIKLLLVVLFGLGGLATQAGSEAVLPAYVAGLVVAGMFLRDRVLMDRLRSIAFALLTPFFFLRAGTLVSAPALVTGAGVIGALLLVKLAAKVAGVWPVAAGFRVPRRERTYTTLLMATGLTFGSIAALFGLTHHLISKSQYTELVAVVILSAFVPTLIAQQLFRPSITDREEEEALGEEDVSIIHRGTR
jgi:Kef-type K+ transport system membrane component KefB